MTSFLHLDLISAAGILEVLKKKFYVHSRVTSAKFKNMRITVNKQINVSLESSFKELYVGSLLRTLFVLLLFVRFPSWDCRGHYDGQIA